MRQVKFRAWDKQDKKMFYTSKETIFEFSDEFVGVSIAEGGWYGSLGMELMQLTGLQDKNGVDIYEGDIIGGKSELIQASTGRRTGEFTESYYLVIWHKDGWGTKQLVSNWNPKLVGKVSSGLKIKAEHYGVIGNIYQNPELINLTV